jgi:hypothetical protein
MIDYKELAAILEAGIESENDLWRNVASDWLEERGLTDEALAVSGNLTGWKENHEGGDYFTLGTILRTINFELADGLNREGIAYWVRRIRLSLFMPLCADWNGSDL